MKEKLFYAGVGFMVCLFVTMLAGRWAPLQPAHAQFPGAGAGAVTLGIGQPVRGVMPIVLVDSTDNSIMLYEADVSRRDWELTLKNARTYRYDKQIPAYNTEPPIGWVRERLDR